jgi:hypothetical protein
MADNRAVKREQAEERFLRAAETCRRSGTRREHNEMQERANG